MEITIKDKAYKLKYTLRALFIFEQITGKMFDIKTLTDEYVYFYCLIMANNKDANLTFDEFIDAIDEDPTLMNKYKDFMDSEMKKQKQINSKEESNSKKKH